MEIGVKKIMIYDGEYMDMDGNTEIEENTDGDMDGNTDGTI